MSDAPPIGSPPRHFSIEVWSSRVLWTSALFCIGTVGLNILTTYSTYRARAAIECNMPIFDFGEVFDGDAVEHTFLLRNLGSSEVVISKTISGCGCMIVADDIEGKSIPPGGKLQVPARLDTRGTLGEVSKPIRLLFEGHPRVPVTLTMRGEVKSRLALSPSRLVLADLKPSTKATQIITVTPEPGAPKFQITSARSPAPYLSVALNGDSGTKSTEPAVHWDVAVKTIPPLPVGRLNTTVYIETTDPIIGTIPVRVVLGVKESPE